MAGKPRARNTSHAPPPPEAPSLSQLDLFPFKAVIERLDPKKVVGPRTAVQHVVRVKMRPTEPPHIIFHDRHGWYCEAHGSSCSAVQLAQKENDEF